MKQMTSDEFRRIRKKFFATQSDAAKALGIKSGQTLISLYETNAISNPIPARTALLMRYIDKYGYDSEIMNVDLMKQST